MRCKNIKITFEIPIEKNVEIKTKENNFKHNMFKDGNDTIYDTGALINEVLNFKMGIPDRTNFPLMCGDKIIGIVNKLSYKIENDKDYLVCEGTIRYGGTCESIRFKEDDNENKYVYDMCFTSFGFDEEIEV